MTGIIPQIGAKGYFTLSPPFNVYSSNKESYTCTAVRTIGDFIKTNEDPYNTIYVPNGLTAVQFQTDVTNNTYIVSLQRDNGFWLSLPVAYISSAPLASGVEYHNAALTISLGLIKTTYDATTLINLLSNVVYDSLGVTPVIQFAEVSSPQYLSQLDSTTLETARTAIITQQLSDRGKCLSLQTLNNNLLFKIAQLENYIKAHYIP